VTWLEGPGIPPKIVNFTTAGEKVATKLADDYIALKGDSSPPGYESYLIWPGSQKSIF